MNEQFDPNSKVAGSYKTGKVPPIMEIEGESGNEGATYDKVIKRIEREMLDKATDDKDWKDENENTN